MDSEMVKTFLEDSSSFGFEVQVIREMKRLGLDPQHSGTYSDPSTGVFRQYDIRARQVKGDHFVLLATECKNIGEEFPLVIPCTKRESNESYHQIFRGLHGAHSSKSDRIGESKIYLAGELVGRSLEQAAPPKKSVSKTAMEVRAKFSQAQQHAIALTPEIKQQAAINGKKRAAIFPCLVVPNDRLWICQYDEGGEMVGKPKKVNRVPLFLGLSSNYQLSPAHQVCQYSFSHIEILTLAGISEFHNLVLGGSDWKNIFTL
jgi:hypothetical protein